MGNIKPLGHAKVVSPLAALEFHFLSAAENSVYDPNKSQTPKYAIEN